MTIATDKARATRQANKAKRLQADKARRTALLLAQWAKYPELEYKALHGVLCMGHGLEGADLELCNSVFDTLAVATRLDEINRTAIASYKASQAPEVKPAAKPVKDAIERADFAIEFAEREDRERMEKLSTIRKTSTFPSHVLTERENPNACIDHGLDWWETFYPDLAQELADLEARFPD